MNDSVELRRIAGTLDKFLSSDADALRSIADRIEADASEEPTSVIARGIALLLEIRAGRIIPGTTGGNQAMRNVANDLRRLAEGPVDQSGDEE